MKNIDLLLENIDCVLFDVDGTLIDSMGLWKEVDRIYLNSYNIPMPDDLQKKLSGLSIQEAAAYFRYDLGIDEPPEKMLSDWNRLAKHEYEVNVPLKAGALRLIKELESRGIKMGVGTSNTRMLATTVLERFDLIKYMGVMLTGEDVKIGKPDPYIYLKGAETLGVSPDRCLVFEDIPAGIMAGKSAGMKVCAVYDRFSQHQTQEKKELADYYVNSLEDIFDEKMEIL